MRRDVFWDVGIGGLLSVTLFTALTGGGRLGAGGFALSVRDWTRPAILLAVLCLCWIVVLWRDRASPDRLQRACDQLARAGLAAIVLLLGGLGLWALVDSCGGLDSHGYVSAARAVESGHLTVAQPLVSWLPLERAIDSLAPLGWVPAVDGHAIVPRFPLGLPLVMAAFEAIAGPRGPFYVAPVLGAATVWFAFVLARRAGDARAAGLAAALVAAHPLFFTYAIQPMSDVPATFWIGLAVTLLYRDRQFPVLAGAAAGMATLTRPTLAVAGLVLAGFSDARRRFLIGILPFVGISLAVNAILYGSPLSSGYGGNASLFAVHVVPRNVVVYGKWLLIINTPLLALLLVAAWFVVDRRLFAIGCTVFAAVSLPYLFYVFEADDWEMLRFLLPGLVPLIAVAAVAAAALAERHLPMRMAPLAVVALAGGVAAASLAFLEGRGVFRLRQVESKYPAVASWIDQHTAADAIVLAALHSGSVHYYSGRTTLRWDQIPPDRLAPTLAAVAARKRAAFLVIDGDGERLEFFKRFGANPPARIAFVDRVQNVFLATIAASP